MAYIDGTRTANLTMSHTQNVLVRIWNPFATQPLEPDYDTHFTNFTFGGHLGFSASLAIAANVVAPSPGAAWTWELRANITVNNGHGSSNTSYTVLASGSETGSTTYADASATCAGTFSASVGVDKLWDIAEDSYSSSVAPTRFPSLTGYTWYERTTTSSTAACSLSAGGSSVAVSAAATSRRNADYTATLSASGFSSGDVRHDFAVSLVKVNTVAVHDITHAHTWYDQSATEWSLSLLGTTDGFGIVSTASGTISTSSCLDRNVSIVGRIRAWEGAYPDNLDVVVTGYDGGTRTITSSGGSYGGQDTFVAYSSTTVLTDPTYGSNTLTTALNDVPEWISAQLSGSGLTTNGDSPTDNRVLFRGFRFNGWSIAETNNRAISGTGNDRTYTPYEGMSGYRYLAIQIKAQSGTNQAGYIELTDYHGNTKRWQVVAPTTSYSTVTLDLCSPDVWSLGALPATDDKDNPYPRKNTASSSYAGSESVDSAYWGVTSCQRLRVSSGSIDIGTTTLTYTNTDSTYVPDTFTAQFERITPAIVAEAETTTYYYGRRFWQQDRDGRTEEESDVWWQMTVGGATGVTSYSVDPVTIIELTGQINASDNSIVRHPGWTATNSVAYPAGATCSASQPPLRDCFLNGVTGYSTWLYGGGILATPHATTGTDFAYGHQIAAGTITAQTLFDRINGNFPPDLSDPFDINGGTDAALYLAGGSLLRGIAHGAILDSAGDPAATGTVDLLLASTSANRGTDSTLDAEGRYYTSAPWGLGESNHDAIQGSNNIGIDPLHTSHRFRSWFRSLTAAGGCLAVDVAPNQRLCYANVESHTVVLHFADGPNGSNYVEVTTGITGVDCVAIAYDPTSASGRLYILVEKQSGGGIDSYYTDDEGATVSMATVVSAAGTHVSVAINPMGKRCVVFRHTGNDLHRVIYDPQGNVITASSAVVASGVANDQTAISWRLGNWYLYYHATSTGITQLVSVDDGETFA
jgi:hypothetical protein